MTEWPADYNPKLSMENCMLQASRHIALCNGTMAVDLMAVRLANVDVWTRLAQVHATNMQTEIMQKRWHCENVCCRS
jgi:hypothetical protein